MRIYTIIYYLIFLNFTLLDILEEFYIIRYARFLLGWLFFMQTSYICYHINSWHANHSGLPSMPNHHEHCEYRSTLSSFATTMIKVCHLPIFSKYMHLSYIWFEILPTWQWCNSILNISHLSYFCLYKWLRRFDVSPPINSRPGKHAKSGRVWVNLNLIRLEFDKPGFDPNQIRIDPNLTRIFIYNWNIWWNAGQPFFDPNPT